MSVRKAAETRSPIRMRPGAAVQRFRDEPGKDLHPLLVVADWLTNRLRTALGWSRAPWDRVEAKLAALVPGIPAFTRVPHRAPQLGALPTLAAGGGPASLVRDAFAGAEGGSDAPGWHWDQARAWAATAGRWP